MPRDGPTRASVRVLSYPAPESFEGLLRERGGGGGGGGNGVIRDSGFYRKRMMERF